MPFISRTKLRYDREKPQMNVVEALITTYLQARMQQQECLKKWNSVSYHLGPLLPASLLVFTIQQQGETDAVLRCVEDEFADPQKLGRLDLALQYYSTLATYWIGGVYEILRLLRERKLISDHNFEPLMKDFELLRIPLEKHEIAKDREFKEPQNMSRVPPKEAGSNYYTYDPKSPTRAHIMPSGLSSRGSMVWQTIDAKSKETRWIERRSLSDKILELWGSKTTQQDTR